MPADLSSTKKRATVEQYGVDVGIAAWEIDFFGRIRSLEQAALEEFLATEQARRSAQILLVSGVANTYLTLAADLENLQLAQTTLQGQQGALELVKRRSDRSASRGPNPDIDRLASAGMSHPHHGSAT